jgi:SAM-dependent methyltransferase
MWLRRLRQSLRIWSRSSRLARDRDVDLAYRLILRRRPDESSRAHYAERVERGLPLVDVILTLLDSEEFRNASRGPRLAAAGEAGADISGETPRPPDRISPGDVIGKYSVEELIATADEYYRRVVDPTPLMSKPWAALHETPDLLCNLGALLAGLELGKGMSVLDFGAGTCWLSRSLAQLGCRPICCDGSEAALAIGRRLFEACPPIGTPVQPTFLLFDGHRIALPDASVDRIICFDSFHHVPNQREILAEFSRVLRPGGVAGFSEPGREHSRSAQSQYEMRNFRVLENDVRLDEIFELARREGFTHLNVSALADSVVSMHDYMQLVSAPLATEVADDIVDAVRAKLLSRSVFFLHKGMLRRDSRGYLGLAHELRCASNEYSVPPGMSLDLTLQLANTGGATWLSRNDEPFGIVRLGTHLCDGDGRLLEVDHSRHDLPTDVHPGESITMNVTVPLPAEGSCRIAVDLVAEGVMWFENNASRPLYIRVNRR